MIRSDPLVFYGFVIGKLGFMRGFRVTANPGQRRRVVVRRHTSSLARARAGGVRGDDAPRDDVDRALGASGVSVWVLGARMARGRARGGDAHDDGPRDGVASRVGDAGRGGRGARG